MTLLSAALPFCRSFWTKPLASFVFLAASVLLPCTAHAQGWYTSLVPCDQNGVPVSGGDSNGDPYRQQMIDGVLTGSGASSQSLPPSVTGGYDTIPSASPNDWRQGGTYNYFWKDDDPPSVWAEAGSHLYAPTSDSPLYNTSKGTSTVHFALSAHYLWSAGWDNGDTGAPPNLATKPAPPASEQFLLQTQLTATAAESYYANGYQPVPASDYHGLSASSSVQDDVFNESVGIVFPAQPSPLSGQHLSQSGGGKHIVTASLQMINGKAVYTVTLSGTGSASAVGAIGNMGLDGLADAEAYLNGYVTPDNRTVRLHRDGAHNETVDVDGTVHGDTTYSYIAGNTAINNAQSFYPTFTGLWSPNPQYIADGTGPLINISWKWALPGAAPQFVDTWNSHGLNTDIGSLRSAGPDSSGNPQWTGTKDPVEHINVSYTATDLRDQATASANYDLRVHDQYDNWRRVDSHGSPMDLLAAGDIGSLDQIGQNTAQRMDVPTVSIQEAGVDWNAVGIVGGGVFSGTSLLIAGIGASSLDPPIWPVTIIGLVGLGIQTVSSLPPPPPPAPVAPPDQINASLLQTAYQNYVHNQTAYPGEENNTNLVDTNFANSLASNPDFSGFDGGNYGTVSITATVYAKMLDYYFYADQYDRGGLVTTTASSTLHRPGGHAWRYLWSYAGSVPLPTNPK